jgi:alcohol dehydrogenase class IV
MGYTFFCPTKFIVSEDAAEDLVRELGEPADGLIFVLTDPGIIKAGIVEPMNEKMRQAGFELVVYSDVPGNPNIPDVHAAMAALDGKKPAKLVALGGGSVIDTAKAAAILLADDDLDYEEVQWRRATITKGSLPLIAVPTTAGTGSEMTHVTVIGDSKGFKMGVVHEAVFTNAAILDGNLMLSLPAKLTAATGMDALVHAIEAYLGKRANPTTDMYALTAIKAVTCWLPEATKNGSNLKARQEMAQAAAWGGMSMDQAGLGLVHSLAGPLCARFHLHHGLGVAVLLPATMAFNAEAIQAERWEALRDALGMHEMAKPADLQEWALGFMQGLELPTTLTELDVDPAALPELAEAATRMVLIHNNNRTADADDCLKILEATL